MEKPHMKSSSITWKVHLITAILLTFFLAYIDEGYYSFKWMSDFRSWLSIAIWVGANWLLLYLISIPFRLLLKEPKRTWFSTFFGSTLSLALVMYITYIILV